MIKSQPYLGWLLCFVEVILNRITKHLRFIGIQSEENEPKQGPVYTLYDFKNRDMHFHLRESLIGLHYSRGSKTSDTWGELVNCWAEGCNSNILDLRLHPTDIRNTDMGLKKGH